MIIYFCSVCIVIFLRTGTFGASSFEERYLATGDFEGNLDVHDLNYSSAPVYSVKAHSNIINSIDGVGGLNIGKGKIFFLPLYSLP